MTEFYAFRRKGTNLYWSKCPVTHSIALTRDPAMVYYFQVEDSGVSFFIRNRPAYGLECSILDNFEIVEVSLP